MRTTGAGASERIIACNAYLDQRTGSYELRCHRYQGVASQLLVAGLDGSHLVVDVGAGATEFDLFLRTRAAWRGRYWPVDGAYDGTDLETWIPPRTAEWFVLIEVIEHLRDPFRLLRACQAAALRGVVLTTPNPETTDVLGMDPTHRTPVTAQELELLGFTVQRSRFYGKDNDSLLACWLP